jgi:hypothetical protein
MAYFQTKKSHFASEEDVGIPILWSFGLFCGQLVYFMVIYVLYFSPFWYVLPRKIWQPCSGQVKPFKNSEAKHVLA